jgi:hypothetical protein
MGAEGGEEGGARGTETSVGGVVQDVHGSGRWG